MHIEFPDDGGILIVGEADELRDLAGDLNMAANEGEAIATLLTDDGVEQITVRCLMGEAD